MYICVYLLLFLCSVTCPTVHGISLLKFIDSAVVTGRGWCTACVCRPIDIVDDVNVVYIIHGTCRPYCVYIIYEYEV